MAINFLDNKKIFMANRLAPSCIAIRCKMAELFRFFLGSSQHEYTIITWVMQRRASIAFRNSSTEVACIA